MSIELILSSGFLFLGGLLLQVSNLMPSLGMILALLGVIPLLAAFTTELIRGYRMLGQNTDPTQSKEDSHENFESK